ncbi:NEP-interacting protein, putative (DUF239) [Arabidopsis thaliana]|uniref:NEP-interacting protein, putative (DUF239) n=1 Tax=Arabidopsis thaliana TaxID=3702 RepID=O82168_ARATH|nr:NEP-interacting protein, putative (DUF239) [Arabidopsis thaliana]AAC61813.1 hypothetical protein [Arabidopsis thaliana]AEC09086.1 NEP-interacting protein, putative (DUF239) [Arabidopsis thaliana]|eukprot:NP_181068.1 NEP-interacting protein, putative (DUF239) [Arabidopsis thaliana]
MALRLALSLCVYLLFTQGAQGNTDDFDCVEIYKQPAFQHPLLKDHKIQETFSLDGKIERSNKYNTKEHCPKGTVAILRQRNVSKGVHLNTAEYSGQHFATIETILDGSIYRGAEADISIHDLKLQNNQYSKSQIWLENGPPGQLNSIQAGLAVHPRLYGDSVTRFTIYWTGDGYQKTGCYNTQCPGFVVVSRNSRIGSGFWGTSVYGKTSLTFKLQVFQDGFSGNWALKMFDEVIGYWPKELFSHLNNGASLVRYGGNTFESPDGISPPMGNGFFPVADFKKTAHFNNVVVINSDYKRVYIEGRKIRLYVDSYNCFRATYWGYTKSTGEAFSFGGPGGNCGF